MPLASALRKELSGNFGRAAASWLRALQDPSGGLDDKTGVDVGSLAGDAGKLPPTSTHPTLALDCFPHASMDNRQSAIDPVSPQAGARSHS